MLNFAYELTSQIQSLPWVIFPLSAADWVKGLKAQDGLTSSIALLSRIIVERLGEPQAERNQEI